MNEEITNNFGKEKKFKKWCKQFIWAFSISGIIYLTWRLFEFFQNSGCGFLDKCTIATFSLTAIISFIIYAIAEVIRQ